MYDTYVTVTGGRDMEQFWKSSPKELFAWMEALTKKAREKDKDIILGEGEF